MTRKARTGYLAAGTLALFAGVPAYVGWSTLFARDEPTHYEDVEDLFKYGSLGGERLSGLPYWVWKVLPDAFPYLMPADSGYKSFGFLYEEGRDVPLGLTKERIGFDRVNTNCAMCHISRYRASPEDEPTLFLSGTNTVFNGQAYFNFLFDAVNEDRFNADTLLAYIDRETTLGPAERAAYRYLLIPTMQKKLKLMQNRLSWWYRIPEPGPGRWIAFNDLKFFFSKHPQDRSVGNPDVPPLWNMAPRQAVGNMHWDGFSDDFWKSSQNAAIAGGAAAKDVPWDDVRRLVAWWMVQPPPPYAFPVDQALASEGAAIWEATCASCHQIGNPTAGRILHIDSIGTDRSRFDLVTPRMVEGYNRNAEAWYGFESPQIQKSEGYVALLLDGIWMRAPYLHNGSVPTMWDLLQPPELRPVTFYRGYDVYDPVTLGYVSSGPEAAAVGFLYDTRLQANGNGGHLYGTDLPDAQKWALIEYLKTF